MSLEKSKHGEQMKLVISCMDRRLNSYLDTYVDNDTVILRNAGANVNGLKSTIRRLINDNNVSEIRLVAHTDCGAMNVVNSVLSGKITVSDSVYNSLVSQFADKKFSSRAELEQLNEKLQVELLHSMAGEIKITSELYDLNRNPVPESKGEHMLAYTRPNEYRYDELTSEIKGEMNGTYFVHSLTLDEAKPDLEIATKNLGIRDLVFVATKSEQYREMMLDMDRAKMVSEGDVHFRFVKLMR